MNEGDNSIPTMLPVATPSSPKEELELELQRKREQLIQLRRQQEELERQKGDLEDLRRKQDEYARGKAEMTECLTRGLVLLEREQIQAQRLGELCAATRQAFREHLEQVQSLNDQEWNSANLRGELTKALGVIENAHLEYNRARTKLDCLTPAANAAGVEEADPSALSVAEFLRYAKIGAAASLPVIIVGTIWLLIFLSARR